jgi:hypothetical protein
MALTFWYGDVTALLLTSKGDIMHIVQFVTTVVVDGAESGEQAANIAVKNVVGDVLTYLVETIRHEGGDTIFIEVTSKDGTIRVVLPPKVANTIARQRDALTKKTRQRVGREQAAERKAQGIEPFGGKRYKRS